MCSRHGLRCFSLLVGPSAFAAAPLSQAWCKGYIASNTSLQQRTHRFEDHLHGLTTFIGRNLKSCMDAWDALRAGQSSSFPPNYPVHAMSGALPKRKPPPESLDPFASAPPPKRRQSGDTTIGAQRVIQPKPSSNGQSPLSFSSAQPGQQPKKRGRPSKAEVEARNAELVARGEVIPPSKASTPRSKASGLPPRDPESMVQRETIIHPARTPAAPMQSSGTGESTASEPSAPAPFESMRSRPAEGEVYDQSGEKQRFPDSSSSQKDYKPGEAGSSATIGAQPQYGEFEARPPTTQPQTQLPPPRMFDPGEPQGPTTQMVPPRESVVKETAGAQPRSNP
jgi:hypothetical protein